MHTAYRYLVLNAGFWSTNVLSDDFVGAEFSRPTIFHIIHDISCFRDHLHAAATLRVAVKLYSIPFNQKNKEMKENIKWRNTREREREQIVSQLSHLIIKFGFIQIYKNLMGSRIQVHGE